MFGEEQKKQLQSFLETEEYVRDIPTPEYAYRVLDSKSTWNDKVAWGGGTGRQKRLTQQLELQANVLTKKKNQLMHDWMGHYEASPCYLLTC